MSTSSADSLTRKQRQAYDLLMSGKSPDEAAAKMKITRQGVYQHMKTLREKGLALPTNGKRGETTPAKPTPPAKPMVSATTNGHADPEAALIAAKQEIGNKIAALEAEIAQLDARGQKYDAALAALN